MNRRCAALRSIARMSGVIMALSSCSLLTDLGNLTGSPATDAGSAKDSTSPALASGDAGAFVEADSGSLVNDKTPADGSVAATRWCIGKTQMFCDDFDVAPFFGGWSRTLGSLASDRGLFAPGSAPASLRCGTPKATSYQPAPQALVLEHIAGPTNRVVLNLDMYFDPAKLSGISPFHQAQFIRVSGDDEGEGWSLMGNTKGLWLSANGADFGAISPFDGWQHVYADISVSGSVKTSQVRFGDYAFSTSVPMLKAPPTAVKIFVGVWSPEWTTDVSANFDNVTVDWL